ncbi:MAG TPA: 4'-phosphopantetheinyl transferase superfamily protein [Mucilaginibacter sp.]|jgi:4'-phosphopantetheinyl transferase EntD|nr:4'-phosphopantetheinyl transferase superfamily protein [Mucilaginibacter sp.]
MSYSFSHLDPSLFSQSFTTHFVDTEVLTAGEKALVEKAGVQRQRHFSTGRYCAREALRRFGVNNAEILMGEVKEPLWPDGFVGSISHSKKLTGAIVARAGDIAAIGLDIETIGGVGRDMWDMLFVDSEQAFLNTLDDDGQSLFATLMFSFKEAFYKLQYPLTKQYLDFKEAVLQYAGGIFTLRTTSEFDYHKIPVEQLVFKWDRFDDQVIGACYLPVNRPN